MTSPISSVVLRRVRTIHLLRTIGWHAFIACAVFVVALVGIGHEVWVAQVLENTPSLLKVRTFIAFAVSAFTHTEFVVQLYVCLAFVALTALFVDAIRVLGTLIPRKLFVA